MLFLLCAAGALYVVAGYPALLGLLARLRSQPVRKRPITPSVTVLLPVHNGDRWLAAKIESILALDYPRESMQAVVICNGCTDDSEAIARRYPVEVLSIPQGDKGLALNRGMQAARGEILFFTDVRQPLNQEALRELAACFGDDRVGVATGELIILDGSTREEARVGLYWKYEKWIRKHLSRYDSLLGATGCIYAMRRDLARPLPPGTLLDDVHLPMLAFLAGYRIVMEEAARAYDKPTGLEAEFRRKVRTQAGVYQLIGQFPALLWPGTRMWLHFVSYKAGRLMLPFLFIGAAAGSILLVEPWRGAAIALQILFYGLAAINRWVPQRFPLKRLTATASAVVVLIGAALCAVSILFVPADRLWKRR